MKKNISKIFAGPDENIRSVIKRLTKGKEEDPSIPPGITLVVDKKEKLLGIVTNGDLRRAFASGIKLDDPISRVMNKKPSVIVADDSANILPTLFAKIKAGEWPKNRLEKILVVDNGNRVVDLVSFYDLVHTSDVRFKHIGVLGLGYVGLTLGLTLADLGFKVRGFDINPSVLKALEKGRAHFYEEGLKDLIDDNLGKNFSVAASELILTTASRIFLFSFETSAFNSAFIFSASALPSTIIATKSYEFFRRFFSCRVLSFLAWSRPGCRGECRMGQAGFAGLRESYFYLR